MIPMTNKDALKLIQDLYHLDNAASATNQAFYRAILALSAQVPTQIIDTDKCPCCKSIIKPDYGFCPYCGQALTKGL